MFPMKSALISSFPQNIFRRNSVYQTINETQKQNVSNAPISCPILFTNDLTSSRVIRSTDLFVVAPKNNLKLFL